jgi:acetyl esterase
MIQQYDKITGEDFNGELCPQAQAIVQTFNHPDAPPVEETDIQAARETHALEAFDIETPSTETQVEDRQIEVNNRRIDIRIYTPAGDGPFPILVFAHGSCWTFCSLDSHDRLCRYYSHHAHCVVVSVDSALAPEYPFPQGLNDFHDAVLWCFEHADAIRGDAKRVAVAGDSAGGNLSSVVAQRLQSHPCFRLSLQLLIYPICDASNPEDASMNRYVNGYFFTQDVLTWTASLYAKNLHLQHPDISPLYGDVNSNLAPAFFLLAECDILRDQGLAYAQKLREAGVAVQCMLYRGVPHAFVAMADSLDLGRQALADSAKHLRLAFDCEEPANHNQ